jgi:hypothetical protein
LCSGGRRRGNQQEHGEPARCENWHWHGHIRDAGSAAAVRSN